MGRSSTCRACLLWCLAGCVAPLFGAEVAVIQGRGDRGPFRRAVECALAEAAVEFQSVKPAELSAEALAGCRIVVLPYFSRATPEEAAIIRTFVESGGKLIAFFRLPEELCELLGVSLGPFLQDTPSHPFYAVRFTRDEQVIGLPEGMVQESWNIFTAYPVGETRIIGGWCDASGQESGHPAVFASEHGFYLNHVLTADDVRAKSQFMLALVGHFLPKQWEKSARKVLADFGKGERYKSLTELQQLIRSRSEAHGLSPDVVAKAEKRVREALGLKQTAESLCQEGNFARAFQRGRVASELLASAYYMLFPSREQELRGVFVASPNPAPDWVTVCNRLREAGFNAVFPYAGSAGIAHYRSECVPQSSLVAEGVDGLQACLTAAHDAGLNVYAWHNLFNVSDAGESFRAQMASARRLVPGVTGEASYYLCPTQPENRVAVLQACVDLVRHYDVDGLFLDYLRYPFRPGRRFCTCAVCRQTFQRDTGVSVTSWPADVVKGALVEPFNQWQQEQLRKFLGELRPKLEEARPGLVVSVAVFGWPGARKNVAQNLSAWVEDGTIDLPLLMNYTDSASFFEKLAKQQAEEIGDRTPWCTAIGAFSHAAQFASPWPLLEQLELTRKHGADGFVVFRLNYTLLHDFLPALREGATSLDSVLPQLRR